MEVRIEVFKKRKEETILFFIVGAETEVETEIDNEDEQFPKLLFFSFLRSKIRPAPLLALLALLAFPLRPQTHFTYPSPRLL